MPFFQTKKKLCRAVLLQADIEALRPVLDEVRDFEAKSVTRLKDGDIAEVDTMKLAAERKKILRLIDSLYQERESERQSLGIALGMATASLILPQAMPAIRAPEEGPALLGLARKNRAALNASRENSLGAETALLAAKKAVRYPVELEGGYKHRNGGFQGFVLGVSVPLPWSNRNRGKIQALTAERDAERLRMEAVETTAIGNISVSLDRLAFLTRRQEELNMQRIELEEIIRVARFSYEEGEVGLLELLDAIRSRNEVSLDINRTLFERWSVLFDLENLTGTTLTGTTLTRTTLTDTCSTGKGDTR